MQVQIKDIYRYLISHTFPGTLLLAEILIMYDWLLNKNIHKQMEYLLLMNIKPIVIFSIIAFVMSTTLGMVIDSIHHLFLEDFPKRGKLANKFKSLSTDFHRDIYVHFLEDDLYYPSEFCENIGIAMVPLTVMLPIWLSNKHLPLFWIISVSAIYLIVVIITFITGKNTYHYFVEHEKDFIEVYSKNH